VFNGQQQVPQKNRSAGASSGDGQIQRRMVE